MTRRIHRPDGGIYNRRAEEQEIFRGLLEKELRNTFNFTFRKPFCCITLNGLYLTTLGNNEVYQNIVNGVLKSIIGNSFESLCFWGNPAVQAHHIVPVDLGGLHITKNGVFVDSYLHSLLHEIYDKTEVSSKLQKIASGMYFRLTQVPEVTGIIKKPTDFWYKWGILLRSKGLLPSENNQNNRRI